MLPLRKDLLLCTRFGIGVTDAAWFEHRLILIDALTVPSLAAQQRKTFRWCVFIDENIPPPVLVKLKKIVGQVAGTIITTLPHSPKSLIRLSQELDLVDSDGNVFTARIDDDDAWHPSVVSDMYLAVSKWSSNQRRSQEGVGVTFANGVEWIMYDMKDAERNGKVRTQAVRPYRYPFLAMSTFVFGRMKSGISCLASSHSRLADTLRSLGADIVVIENQEPMWLYCRHKQALSSLQKSRSSHQDIDISNLIERFGLSGHKVMSYIESAGDFGYLVEKRADDRRKSVQAKLADDNLNADERRALEAEFFKLSARLIGDLP